MTALPAEQPPSYGLVPTTMGEAIRLAEMMAGAKLVPQALQKSPADCLMVVQQAIRWNMDPFAVAQECSVIQGKLMHSGKLVAAVVNARGNLANRLSFEYEGEGDNRTITVTGRLQNEAEARHVTVRLGDAKTGNRVWQTQPDQQLMYHGARVWARRHTPELMLGVYSPEEFDEPAIVAKKPPRPAPLKLAQPIPHDPETGEISATYFPDPESDSEPAQRSEPPAAPADDNPPSSPTAGAAPIPTAEQYVERWTNLVDAAVPSQADQIHKTWNEEKKLRNMITWPDDDTFAKLQAKVKAALEMLRKG